MKSWILNFITSILQIDRINKFILISIKQTTNKLLLSNYNKFNLSTKLLSHAKDLQLQYSILDLDP